MKSIRSVELPYKARALPTGVEWSSHSRASDVFILEREVYWANEYFKLCKLALNERVLLNLVDKLLTSLNAIDGYSYSLVGFVVDHAGHTQIRLHDELERREIIVLRFLYSEERGVKFNIGLSLENLKAIMTAFKAWCDETMKAQQGYNLFECKCGTPWHSMLYGQACAKCGAVDKIKQKNIRLESMVRDL